MSYPLPLVWQRHLAAEWAADLDLSAVFPGMRAVVIRVETAGAGVLVFRAKGSPTVDVTFPALADDDEFHMAITAIDSTTTLTSIWVGYADSSLPEV